MVSYFENEIEVIAAHAQEIIQHNSTIADKLSKIMQMHLSYLVESKQIFLKLSLEAQRLSLESQDRIQAKRHAYQDMLRSLIEEGIQREEFRPVNPLFAARSIFSLLSIAVFTSRPTGTPEEMLDQALGILFQGIKA
jgi:hypothetical protein